MAIRNRDQEIRYHYDLLRDDVKKTIEKLNANLGYYSFRPFTKSLSTEIFYDTPDNMLSGAGVVLSKYIEGNEAYIQIRKLSYIDSKKVKAGKKIKVVDCTPKQTARDFIVQIAAAINNMYENIFTIDLSEIIKKVISTVQIDIKGDVYQIAGGTGYRATLSFEKNIYRDLKKGKVVKKKGATFISPSDPNFDKEREEVLYGIDRYCKELFPYNESRFEIASRVLRSKKEIQEAAEERRVEEEKARKMAEEE